MFQVRQIRNRLSSSDWLFLNACLGIVNNDASAVRAYLRQEGGDRARQLTKEECLVLGQPSTFSVGGTLAHLAIRYMCIVIHLLCVFLYKKCMTLVSTHVYMYVYYYLATQNFPSSFSYAEPFF